MSGGVRPSGLDFDSAQGAIFPFEETYRVYAFSINTPFLNLVTHVAYDAAFRVHKSFFVV